MRSHSLYKKSLETGHLGEEKSFNGKFSAYSEGKFGK